MSHFQETIREGDEAVESRSVSGAVLQDDVSLIHVFLKSMITF